MLPLRCCARSMGLLPMSGVLELYSTFCLVGFPLSGQVATVNTELMVISGIVCFEFLVAGKARNKMHIHIVKEVI
mgnify:CR=1 FL=1